MHKENLKHFFYFSALSILIVVIIACNENKQKEKPPSLINEKVKNDTVYIFNEIKTGKKITFFNQGDLSKYAYPITIRENDSDYVKKVISSDTLVLVEGLKYTPFVIFPGERVFLKQNKNDNIILEVKDDVVRSNELMFFVELSEIISWPSAPKIKISTKSDFTKIDSAYKSAYKNSVDFLNTYAEKNKISTKFYEFSKRYLYYKYLMFLLNPSNYANTKNLLQTLSQFKIDFQNNSDIIVPTYLMAAYHYSLLLLKSKTTEQTFVDHFNLIKEDFQGNTQEFLLYRTLINNVDKESSKPGYKNSAAFFMKKYAQDTLGKIFTKNFDYVNNSQSFLQNNEFQNELLLRAGGDFISWKDMLMLHKGKFIYIDFWATWCGPCVSEFSYSKKLNTQLSSENIVFVYISIDAEKSKWLDALNEFGINLSGENYLLTVPDNSLIKKNYFINSIPRYMIFGKNGELLDKDALRPSDKNLLPRLLKLSR